MLSCSTDVLLYGVTTGVLSLSLLFCYSEAPVSCCRRDRFIKLNYNTSLRDRHLVFLCQNGIWRCILGGLVPLDRIVLRPNAGNQLDLHKFV